MGYGTIEVIVPKHLNNLTTSTSAYNRTVPCCQDLSFLFRRAFNFIKHVYPLSIYFITFFSSHMTHTHNRISIFNFHDTKS